MPITPEKLQNVEIKTLGTHTVGSIGPLFPFPANTTTLKEQNRQQMCAYLTGPAYVS